jgi:hypothetical protein
MGFGSNPADELLNAVNIGLDAEGYISDIKRAHNALQARLFDEVVKQTVIGLAETEQLDRRNREAVEAARSIADHMEWEYGPQRRAKTID